jgi:hypothetical protein
MLKVIQLAVVAVALSGCGVVGPGARYNDAISTVRFESMTSTLEMSQSVAKFLQTGTSEQAVEDMKKSVARSLKDPTSAQFRNVRLVPYINGKVLCGEVNGKNSYGGYSGFTAFVAGTNQSSLYDRQAGYPAIEAASNAGLTAACS